jgi:ribose transport system substrate-binding protein
MEEFMTKRVLLFALIICVLITSAVFAGGKKEADGGKMKIGYVVKDNTGDYWKIVQAGAMAAGKDFDVEVLYNGPNAETEVMQQVSMMEDMITKKVAALVVAPSQPKAAISVFDKADAAGIPVLLADTNADWDKKVTFLGTGNEAAGKIGGEYIAKKLGAGAEIVIVRGALGDLTHDQRSSGAAEAAKAGGCKVIDIQPADSDMAKAMDVMENLIQANPNIKGVFCTSDAMAIGANRAVEKSGKNIIVIGFDAIPVAVEEIMKGKTFKGSVAQSPYNIGYMGVENAIKAAKGEAVEKRIDTGAKMIDASNVQAYSDDLKKMLGK